MTKRIVLSGYYGFGNTGDEAVLAGILATFRQLGVDANITVLSADPARTMSEHPGVESVHRYKLGAVINSIRQADLVISGGGSLLQDVTSTRSARYYLFILQLAHLFKRKTMIYAQGIGPLNNPGIRKAVAKTLNKATAITVRDEDSKKLLESVGVDRVQIQVCADPSFTVEPDIETADKILSQNGLCEKEFIGVSLRPWQSSNNWQAEAIKGINLASEELNIPFVIIPMQLPEDATVCEPFKSGIMIADPGGVRAVKGLISRCSMVVSMRLHSLIFAASEGVPFVPIVYDPKVSSFAKMANQSDGVDIESLNAESLKNAIIQGWDNRATFKEKLTTVILDQKQLALKSGEIAKEILSQ